MSTLILVPTPPELRRLRTLLTDRLGPESGGAACSMELCGFGPIAAAVRCAGLLGRDRPDRVVLIGIAGTYDSDRLPVGAASRFDSVLCDGIGVGQGAEFQSAGELGWQQFPGDGAAPSIGDVIAIDGPAGQRAALGGTLVTCMAASANRQQAQSRRARYPQGTAEDMEGFAVAAACRLAGVPLQIVRGISNVAGERSHRDWQIDAALTSAADMAADLVRQRWAVSPT